MIARPEAKHRLGTPKFKLNQSTETAAILFYKWGWCRQASYIHINTSRRAIQLRSAIVPGTASLAATRSLPASSMTDSKQGSCRTARASTIAGPGPRWLQVRFKCRKFTSTGTNSQKSRATLRRPVQPVCTRLSASAGSSCQATVPGYHLMARAPLADLDRRATQGPGESAW